ncbi:transposase [Thermosulfurimonas dismutans]|uniref:Transposase IS4-like domain-containing protein n=1 Tax=Thermosulfurimonas dismutans TaxID=999894 RepID=A0A179D6Y7_9BACT|nr:transposase [Thermosulfurimonas dismutans]OAQ21816.1 hypothetical protein TDIS_0334 [Thermosulfurimonas dismutans]
MRRSKLRLKTIFKITRAIINEKPLAFRGRPKTYSDAFIISIFLYQTLKNLSYREALEEAFDILGRRPALSTYHYRVSKFPKQSLKILLQELARKLLAKEHHLFSFISDGTGFSYHDLYPLKFLRGSEIRKVKAHIRVVPIIGVTSSGKRIVITAETGGPYASEVKLLLEALTEIDPVTFKAECLIADKCYDSLKVMEKLVELGLKPAIKVKETFRQKVKHPLRKDSRIFWEKWGRNRYLIESLFGTVKLKIGSHFRVRKEEIAQKRGLAAFVLYNMYLLATFLYISLLLKNYFRTLSRQIERSF